MATTTMKAEVGSVDFFVIIWGPPIDIDQLARPPARRKRDFCRPIQDNEPFLSVVAILG